METKTERMQRLENEAFSRFSQKAAEVHALKMDIAAAVGSHDLTKTGEIEEELQRVHHEYVGLLDEYLVAKVNSAIFVKEDMIRQYGAADPDAFNRIIAPLFDKDIWEAENALTRHREKHI